jgi:hypothetical protein
MLYFFTEEEAGGVFVLPVPDEHGVAGIPLSRTISSNRESVRPDERKNPGNMRAMNSSKVFISYVREDSAVVDCITKELWEHGAEVWLDRTHIKPGQRWKQAIRDAIRDGTYFVACFSPSYTQRDSTYMNQELRLAIEQLRMMPLGRRWFIPLILEPCQIPSFEVDAVETLRSFQYIDFSQDWDSALTQLINAVCPPTYGRPT